MPEAPKLYDDYIAFKGWEADAPPAQSEDYAVLLSGARAGAGASLLDIGFGRGDFLDWALGQGLKTAGVEIIPELVERAAARGHDARAELAQFEAAAFDVVTAIDVLEHLTTDQLAGMLGEVRRLLAPQGVFVARFPNGQSPFSVPYQNGDLTHVRWLTPGAVRQVAHTVGLTLAASYNPRPTPPGLRGLKRRAGYLIRDLVETVVGYAYFGHRIPMDPNIVVVLRRA